MLKTILSATAICFACLVFTGCGDDGVEGSVDDYGGERPVDAANRQDAPGVDEDGDAMKQDDNTAGGGAGGG